MIKFINAITGGEMWVADDRVEEYKAAGHELAAEANDEPLPEPPKKRATKKKG